MITYNSVLLVAQILFFALGAAFFLKSCIGKAPKEPMCIAESRLKEEELKKRRELKLTTPLSERTRPQSLDEIVGQEKGIRALRAALCGPNPQHILIYGPPGVGKTAAARLILEEAKRREDSPFTEESKFIELDATTLRFDERSIADPLMGSVHDPIYQGAGAFGQAGIPQPKEGAVSRAHGGVLFLDEIGELHPVQMNKLLKVLEDRVVYLQSSYYQEKDSRIPSYIHDIFRNGLPADFRLIGATTKSPEELPPALRSRCTEIYFEPLRPPALEAIAQNALKRLHLPWEDGVCAEVARFARGGRDAVNIVQSLGALAVMEQKQCATMQDLRWVLESGRYHPLPHAKISAEAKVGVVHALAVFGSMGGALLEVEAVVHGAEQGSLTVTGIVEEEEIKNGSGSGRRKSNARSSVENVLTLLEEYGFFAKAHHVHINFPGGIPVDGPSAGVAMFLAVYSAYIGKPVPSHIAVTGEVGIKGQVLAVGGIAQKVQAAVDAGATVVLLPADNVEEVPKDCTAKIVPLSSVREAILLAFGAEEAEEAVLSASGRGAML